MTKQSRTVLESFQLRKSRKDKKSFRLWLNEQLTDAGYSVTEETGLFSGTNLLAGDPDSARIVFCAHYDTQAVLPFPNFITPKSLPLYILYQLTILIPLMTVCFVLVALGLYPLGLIWLSFFVWWMLFGPANRRTANDNTSGVTALLEIALTLPADKREGVLFVFFDNEERGMLGSSAFASRHKRIKTGVPVINFDCVSDGALLQLYPSSGLKKDSWLSALIESSFEGNGERSFELVSGFGFYPSDNASFKISAGVCALKEGRFLGKRIEYMDRIHTSKDTVFEEENLELIRLGALRLISGLPSS